MGKLHTPVVRLAAPLREPIMNAKALIAVLVCTVLAVVLHGCGCDEDKVKKCNPGTDADACVTMGKLWDCIKDADCCDHEEDGKKVKDVYALSKGFCNKLSQCDCPCDGLSGFKVVRCCVQSR